ncbi:MAG: HEAT repeat domain-containing protein [Candidatus Heimdallarchaeaceae archaeon]
MGAFFAIWEEENDSAVKIEILRALEGINHHEADIIIDEALDDKDTNVQKAAFTVLFNIRRKEFLAGEISFEEFVEFLKNDYWRLRILAVNLLVSSGDENFIDALYAIWEEENDSAVKKEILRVLAEIRDIRAKTIIYLSQQDEYESIRDLAKEIVDSFDTIENLDPEILEKYDKNDSFSVNVDKIEASINRVVSLIPSKLGPSDEYLGPYEFLKKLVIKGEKRALKPFIKAEAKYSKIYEKEFYKHLKKHGMKEFSYSFYDTTYFDPSPFEVLREFYPKTPLTDEEYDNLFSLLKEDDLTTNILAISLLSALDRKKVIKSILQWIREEIPKNRIPWYVWDHRIWFVIYNLNAWKEFFF